MVVDGKDTGRCAASQNQRLATGTATDVENAGLRADAGHERESPERARRLSRSLTGQSVEELEEQGGHSVQSLMQTLRVSV